MAHVTRALPAPAKPLVLPVPLPPAFLTRSVGLCASCGAPLSTAGSGVLRHQRTGTVSCRPVLDPTDGGWAEPDVRAGGPCAAYGRDAAAVARELAALADRYERRAEAGDPRAVTRRHAAQGCRALAVHLALVAGGAA